MQTLKSYDWSTKNIDKRPTKPRSAAYPWPKWFSGKIVLLENGIDFDGPTSSIERVIRTSATRKGLSVKIRTLADGNVVVQSNEAYTNGRTAETAKAPTTKAPAKNGKAPAKTAAKSTKAPAKKVPAAKAAKAAKAPAAKAAKPAPAKAAKPAPAKKATAPKASAPSKRVATKKATAAAV